MGIKPLLLALTAACGVTTGAATNGSPTEQPDKLPPGEPEVKGQQFCCQSVDPKTASGEGCGAISKENINACDKVLSCGEKWTKDGGKVTCLD
jgi:hypothetical protein